MATVNGERINVQVGRLEDVDQRFSGLNDRIHSGKVNVTFDFLTMLARCYVTPEREIQIRNSGNSLR